MRKYVKILFVFFMLFSFNSVVYASNQCFYMHGKNNTVVVPKGYSARCYYSYEQTKSSNGNVNTYNQIAVDFSKDRIVLSSADSSDKILTNFLYLDDVMKPSNYSNSQFNWDGLILNTNSYFISSEYDENINGCPKSIYWVDNISQSEKYLGFSASENPNLSYGKNAKYAVYTLNMETDDQIIFLADNENDGNIYTYPESGKYDLEKEKCDSKNIIRNESDGYGSHHTSTTDTKSETLKTCKYYFSLDNYAGKCQNTAITFTYIKKTESGKSTLSVSTDRNFDLNIGIIQEKINMVNSTNDYSYLSDFLVQSHGSWSCADKIYIWNNSNDDVVFGQSMLEAYTADKAGVGRIVGSEKTNKDLCPDDGGSVVGDGNSDTTIDWGDETDVNCEGIIGQEMLDFIEKILGWIQIIAPIFVIIMGGVDFAGAILQDDKDALKKAANKLIKRLIIAVALFFIPIILNFLLNIFNEVTGAGSSTCVGR